MELPILSDLVVILCLSVAVVYLCSLVRIPAIIGFLLTGAVIGPYGLQLISAVHEVEIMAEIGVVFLLFAIGVEFSLDNFPQIRRAVLGGGTLQVGLTILVTALILILLGQPMPQAFFWGFLLALSSTTIVLKLLQEKAELDAPHGRTSLAILIYQDLIVVPLMLLVPLLGGQSDSIVSSVALLVVKAAFIVSLVSLIGKYGIDFFMHQIARTRSRELFFISTIALCFFITWLTSSLGLSLGLGAFLAGLILSRSEYSYQTLAGILPLRDAFISFFFISIGMLFDVEYTFSHGFGVLGMLAAILLMKGLIASASVFLIGYPLRTSLLVGISLNQIGEFSFILSRAGQTYGLLANDQSQLFLSLSILTMLVTPFLIRIAPGLVDALLQYPLPERMVKGLYYKSMPEPPTVPQNPLKDHLVIVGFGVCGAYVAHAARSVGIRYQVLEMNPDTVRREQRNGEPILYGDASYESVLETVSIHEARILVSTIPDPAATRRIIEMTKRINPRLYVLTRTRFVQEIRPLQELGADEVIPEEFETSIEIFSRVLAKYLVPQKRIEMLIRDIRKSEYEMLRSLRPVTASLDDLVHALPEMEIVSYSVPRDSPLLERTLGEIDLRRRHDVTLLAVHRGEETIPNPAAGFVIEPGDTLILFGRAEVLRGYESRPEA